MIERETGYDTTLECECRPCKSCDAHGSVEILWTQNNRGQNVPCSKILPCASCKGSGQDSDDCAVHGRVETER